MLNIKNFQTLIFVSRPYLECFGEISRKFLKSADAINSLKVDLFFLESNDSLRFANNSVTPGDYLAL